MKKQATSFLLILCLTFIGHAQTYSILGGQWLNAKKDTLKLVLQLNLITRLSETFFIPIVNGRFEIKLEIVEPTYLYVTDGVNYINGLIEPGNKTNIFCNADDPKSSLNFTGKGSEKFTFLNSFIQYGMYKKLRELVPLAKETKYPFDRLLHFIDSAGNAFLKQLSTLKNSMSSKSFSLLGADVKANMMGNKYRSIGMIYHESVDETLTKRQAELTAFTKKYLKNVLKFDQKMFYSPTYINEVYNILFMHYDGLILANKLSPGLVKKYDLLENLLPANLKAPVLTLFLEYDIQKLNQSEDLETVITQTYLQSKDSIFKNYIVRKFTDAGAFSKGMDAPGFVLENQKGEPVTLATLRGKVVYLDFWFAACGPCHVLFQTIKPVKDYFRKNNDVVFLCVSIDPKDIWTASLEKFNIDGYHVFTEDKERNHPIIKAYKVGGYPTNCLIDGNGKIFMANPSSNPEELIKQIEDALAIKRY